MSQKTDIANKMPQMFTYSITPVLFLIGPYDCVKPENRKERTSRGLEFDSHLKCQLQGPSMENSVI